MRKIKIKNFGPIKEGYTANEGYLLINKVTVFIGDQGTGKSSVAKLISTLSWIEKALYQGKIKRGEITLYNRFQKKYCAFQGIDNYFQKDTYIEYLGEAYCILYKSGKIVLSQNLNNQIYNIPKITYIPAERNFLSALEKPEKAKGLPDMLLTFLEEYENARQQLSESVSLPIGDNIHFEFQKQNKISYVVGENYRLKLSQASSGMQSFIPMFLVLDYLSKHIGNPNKVSAKNLSLEEQRKINAEIQRILSNKNYSEETKTSLLNIASSKFTNAYLINIIEEIEQNLFPASQRALLFKTLEINNDTSLNELIITTHSPYIINYLTLAMKGKEVLGTILEKNNKDDYVLKLSKIIPLQACITPEQVSVYELDKKGSIIKLENIYGVISDDNYLNNSLAETNAIFDALLEIEEDVCR